jgi:endonuclease YncB( thermonuclease family)
MARAIEQLRGSGLTVGHTGLGLRGQQNPAPGSARQQVHDGDTVTVRALGNFAVRFLGVDAPEESFPLPGSESFVSIDNAKWDTFLNDPFASSLPPFKPALVKGLRGHLAARVGSGAATNHAEHSDAARAALIGEVERDMQTLGTTKDDFEFFLGFAHEVMDGYGRLLAYINRAQPNAEQPEPRPLSYNERLLEQGMVTPYFIWPNIDPFRKSSGLENAVPRPRGAAALAEAPGALSRARQSVREARAAGLGIFAADELRLYPFELRFLARREPPNRWVIDLTRDENRLLPPHKYYRVQFPEDRLFVPSEYVPLFEHKGWRRGR